MSGTRTARSERKPGLWPTLISGLFVAGMATIWVLANVEEAPQPSPAAPTTPASPSAPPDSPPALARPTTRANEEVPAPDDPASVDASAITGIVHDPFGRPIAGVAVAIRPLGDGDAAWTAADAPTNEHGEFSIAPLAGAGLHALEFRAHSHLARRVNRVAAGARLDVELREGVAIKGRVVDARSGGPIAGAFLSFGADGAPSRSDENGRFECAADPSGLEAEVRKDGFLPWTGAPFTPVAGMELVVRLKPAVATGIAYVRVTDAVDGHPLAHVESLTGPVAEFGGGLVSTGTVASERRRFGALGAPGYAVGLFSLSEAQARTAKDAIPLALERAFAATGRVVDVDGAPVPGVVVTVERAVAADDGLSADPSGTSAADGTFRVEGLPIRTLLVARANDERFADAPEMPLGSDEPVDVQLDPIVMQVAGRIHGRVVDASTSEPIAGATLEARDRTGKKRSARSEADGAFVLHGLTGPARVFASGPRHATRLVDGVATDGDEPIEMALERGLTITGVAVDAERRPVAGARVRIVRWRAPSDRPELAALDDARSQRREVDCGLDGKFELGGLVPGDYWLAAVRTARQPIEPEALPTLTLSADVAGLEIPIVGPSLLSGRVTDARTGEAIVEFSLGMTAERVGHWNSVSDGEGRFLEFVQPGVDTDLTVIAGGHAPFSRAAVRIGVGETREITCALDPESAISGVLLDPNGVPMTGAEISIVGEAIADLGGSVVTTAVDGTFRVGQLAAGTVELSARARFAFGEDASVTRAVDLSPSSVELDVGQDLVQTFVANSSGSAALTVEVLLPQDGSAASASLLLMNFDSDQEAARLDIARSGEVRIAPVAAGRYRVTQTSVRTSDGRTVLNPESRVNDVTVPETGEARLRVELPSVAPKARRP